MSEVIDVYTPPCRYTFGWLLRSRGYRKAVEVGTDLGTFACNLLGQWDGEIICCDNYQPYEWNKWPRESDMIIASTRLAQFGGRGRIAQCESADLARELPQWFREQLDFVYVDAKHDYASVLCDIQTWWPLLTERGMIAGHDFDEERHPDVVRAVNEFAESVTRPIHRVVGDGHCFSWYIERA